MRRVGTKAALLALTMAVFGGTTAQKAAADHCYECFYELCISVPLGYGWDACNETTRCHWRMISPPIPGQDPVYVYECMEVCRMRGIPCFQNSEPG